MMSQAQAGLSLPRASLTAGPEHNLSMVKGLWSPTEPVGVKLERGRVIEVG